MWVKILAGLTAALAVVGVGIYVALPPGHCCHGTSDETPKGSCCLSVSTISCGEAIDDGGPATVSDTPSTAGCCSACKAPNTDALAACTGGMAFSPAPQSTTKLKFACCGD